MEEPRRTIRAVFRVQSFMYYQTDYIFKQHVTDGRTRGVTDRGGEEENCHAAWMRKRMIYKPERRGSEKDAIVTLIRHERFEYAVHAAMHRASRRWL